MWDRYTSLADHLQRSRGSRPDHLALGLALGSSCCRSGTSNISINGSRCRTARRKSDRSRTKSGHQRTTPPPRDPHASARVTASVRCRPTSTAGGGQGHGPPPPWPTKMLTRSATAVPHGLCPVTIPAAAAGGGGVEGDRRKGWFFCLHEHSATLVIHD
jgi:hypothetical protein